MVMLGWAMVGQSSGQTHVGIKMIKHVLCQKKWWCKAKIAMICTVYCIWCIFYWLITRTMWMGHNLAKLSVASPDAHGRRSRCTLIWTTTNDPSIGWDPEDTEKSQCGGFCAICAQVSLVGSHVAKSWGDQQMAADVSRALSVYIHIYIYTYIYIHIDIHIYIYI